MHAVEMTPVAPAAAVFPVQNNTMVAAGPSRNTNLNATLYHAHETLKTPVDGGLLPTELTSEDMRLVAAAFSTPSGGPLLQGHDNDAPHTYPYKNIGGGAAPQDPCFHSVPRAALGRQGHAFAAPLRGTSTESEALCLQQMFTGHEDMSGHMSQIDNELHRLLGGTESTGGGGRAAPSMLHGAQHPDGHLTSHTTNRAFSGLFSPQYELPGLDYRN